MRKLLVKIPTKNLRLETRLFAQVFPPLILLSPVTRP